MTTHPARKGPEAVQNPDERAMASVAEGDGDALEEIFYRWKLPVMNYLYRSVGNFADAEDLTLEVFTDVWRSAPRYRSEGTFSAWLFAIARGKLAHEWRRRSRKPVAPAPVELMEFAASSGRPAESAREWEEIVLKGLQTLPENQRSALLLSVNSPLSSEEIAESLGVSLANFYVLVHRARARMKKFLLKNDYE